MKGLDDSIKNTRQGVWIIGRWPSQIVPAARHSAPRTRLLGAHAVRQKAGADRLGSAKDATAETIVITAPESRSYEKDIPPRPSSILTVPIPEGDRRAGRDPWRVTANRESSARPSC